MPTEWIIVLVIGLLLLFSAKKLPDMARGLGQSMRIFKAETRGMKEDEQRTPVESAPAQPQAQTPVQGPTQAPEQAPAPDGAPDTARPGSTSA